MNKENQTKQGDYLCNMVCGICSKCGQLQGFLITLMNYYKKCCNCDYEGHLKSAHYEFCSCKNCNQTKQGEAKTVCLAPHGKSEGILPC
mgnify:CR=1 FL=1